MDYIRYNVETNNCVCTDPDVTWKCMEKGDVAACVVQIGDYDLVITRNHGVVSIFDFEMICVGKSLLLGIRLTGKDGYVLRLERETSDGKDFLGMLVRDKSDIIYRFDMVVAGIPVSEVSCRRLVNKLNLLGATVRKFGKVIF